MWKIQNHRVQLSERGKTQLAFAALSAAAIAFEVALLAINEPLPPAGPIAALYDRAFDTARGGARGAPGLQVAIVRDGKIAYRYARGSANSGDGTPVTDHTRFRAGSIGRMLTAVCAMQLVEAGRLDLDAPVAAYAAQAPHARDITIRQLLAQTSGLANYTDLAFSTGIVASATSAQGILDPIATQALDFTPGSRYEYSNTNFVVLGEILERIEGRPLAQIERARILVPAGMADSSFAGENAGPDAATGYDDAAGRKGTAPYDMSWLYGSGDLVTTATDLAGFDAALFNGMFVSARTLATMTAPSNDMGDGRERYGLGFTIAPLGTKTLVGHHGGIPGFEADDEIVLRSRFAVVVLANSGSFATAGVGNVVLASLFPADFALAEGRAIARGAGDRPVLDAAIDRRIRTFLNAAATGTVDRSSLGAAFDATLTPAAIARLVAALPPPSTLASLELQARSTQGLDSIYYLTATYAAGTRTFQFVFEPDGRIAGFFAR